MIRNDDKLDYTNKHCVTSSGFIDGLATVIDERRSRAF
jgi:hypothetical protein